MAELKLEVAQHAPSKRRISPSHFGNLYSVCIGQDGSLGRGYSWICQKGTMFQMSGRSGYKFSDDEAQEADPRPAKYQSNAAGWSEPEVPGSSPGRKKRPLLYNNWPFEPLPLEANADNIYQTGLKPSSMEYPGVKNGILCLGCQRSLAGRYGNLLSP